MLLWLVYSQQLPHFCLTNPEETTADYTGRVRNGRQVVIFRQVALGLTQC